MQPVPQSTAGPTSAPAALTSLADTTAITSACGCCSDSVRQLTPQAAYSGIAGDTVPLGFVPSSAVAAPVLPSPGLLHHKLQQGTHPAMLHSRTVAKASTTNQQ